MKKLLLFLMPLLAVSCKKDEPNPSLQNTEEGGCPLEGFIGPYNGPLVLHLTQPDTSIYTVGSNLNIKGYMSGGLIINGAISIRQLSNDSIVFQKSLEGDYYFNENYITPLVPDSLEIRFYFEEMTYSSVNCTEIHGTEKKILIKVN